MRHHLIKNYAAWLGFIQRQAKTSCLKDHPGQCVRVVFKASRRNREWSSKGPSKHVSKCPQKAIALKKLLHEHERGLCSYLYEGEESPPEEMREVAKALKETEKPKILHCRVISIRKPYVKKDEEQY